WDSTAYPNQLMEPGINGDLTHSVVPNADLTLSLLRDVGWKANAIGDNQFFARQHYLDFLNREPDTSGLRFWADGIYACGLDQACIGVYRSDTSAGFFLSVVFNHAGYIVSRSFESAYSECVGDFVELIFLQC